MNKSFVSDKKKAEIELGRYTCCRKGGIEYKQEEKIIVAHKKDNCRRMKEGLQR